MVNLLKNKNRTYRPKITIKTSKGTFDQCDYAQLICPVNFFSEIIKSSVRKQIKMIRENRATESFVFLLNTLSSLDNE